MARDDYYVVVYCLLKCLYDYLKHGQHISNDKLKELSSNLNYDSWIYILANMYEEGFITGVELINTFSGKDVKIIDLQITPKGIDYLQNNSTMHKTLEWIKKNASQLLISLLPK